MHDLSGELTMILTTIWWLRKLGKRFKVVCLYTTLTANTNTYYHKNGQVSATRPDTVATPRTCNDYVLKSSGIIDVGNRPEVNVSFLFPSLCGQQQSLLCLCDSELRARYEDVPLSALTIGQLNKLLQ